MWLRVLWNKNHTIFDWFNPFPCRPEFTWDGNFFPLRNEITKLYIIFLRPPKNFIMIKIAMNNSFWVFVPLCSDKNFPTKNSKIFHFSLHNYFIIHRSLSLSFRIQTTHIYREKWKCVWWISKDYLMCIVCIVKRS